MKTIVACGGSGTRMYPSTRFINKHLIPVGAETLMVDLPLSFLSAQGIRDVSVVTGSNHASQICEYISDGEKYGFKSVSYSFQPKPAGISDVLNRVDIAGQSVLLILGDNAFLEHSIDIGVLESRDRAACFEYDLGNIEMAGRFGQIYRGSLESGLSDRIIEKAGNPLHSRILTGLYYFPKDVFDKLSRLTPSHRNELEITDLLGIYLAEGRLDSYEVAGSWFDLGEWSSWESFVGRYGRTFIR